MMSGIWLLMGVAALAQKAPDSKPDIANDPRTVRSILIVDGSGSMWGRIGRKNKIVVVREVLPKIPR